MNEQILKKRLRNGILLCAFLGSMILAAGIVSLYVMSHSLGRIVYAQMRNETGENRSQILRQLDKDYQTLETLASFLQVKAQMTEEEFIDSLSNANKSNDFVSMAYFDLKGKGIMVNERYGVRTNVDYRTLHEDVQEVVGKAMRGEKAISRLFDSTVTAGRIFVYAVPVYQNGEVAGVLSASDQIEVFQEILKDKNVMGGSGALYLLTAEGKILISSTPEDASVSSDDFFRSRCFNAKNSRKILEAVGEEESVYASMTYRGKSYKVYLNPLRINDWYIMCISDQQSVNSTAYEMVRTMAVTFLLMFSVIVFLLFHVYRLIVDNNARLKKMAYKDRLTGADNMNRFLQNMDEARQLSQDFCLLGLNIHQFKFINEIFGARAGDRILRDMAGQISGIMEEGEFFCRENGDLFCLFLRQTDQEKIKKRIETVMDSVCQQAIMVQMDYQMMMYAGAVLHDAKGEDSQLPNEMLITKLKFAMEYSKQFPANHLHFYDEEIHKSEELLHYIDSHMQQALEKEEFQLYLQPKIRLSDGCLYGAEALVRWIAEDGTVIYPGDFIPQFEKNGFCVQLDYYMLEKAFGQIRRWKEEGREPIPISVNQSKLLFYDSDYIEKLQALLDKYQISPQMITLEILEGLALEHADVLNEKIRRLRKMGFRISMDDFGSGYSSFNTLGKIQIDELKLDRSFLMEAAQDEEGRFETIMGNIIDLSKKLHISTVAEGVETKEDEQLVRVLGCDIGQGYLYSRPVGADDFTELMEKAKR